MAKLAALALALCGTAFAQLNQNCTVSVLNRTVIANADGSWVLPNIPANFGPVKARATCVQNGMTTFGESDFFAVPANGAVNLPDIRLGNTTPIPVSLSLTPGSPTLATIGQTIQLLVNAVYPDGSTADVTSGPGVTYTTSNPAIATISASGLITAVSSGTAVIQASNDGATGIISARVLLAGNDSDNDGIPDDVESQLGLDPMNAIDAQEDFDRDGLTNLREYQLGTDLRKADTDGDGLLDGAEVDTYNTNPLLVDTDGDGVPDGVEVQTGSNPTNATSYNLSSALKSLVVTPSTFSLTVNALTPQASQQLTVTGMLIDNTTTIDLTSTQRGTNYASSNLSICSFGSPDGRVFAGANGGCTITISNAGFTATANGTVSSFTPTALSFVNIPGYANNVDVAGNYAYVAAGSAGLQVVSVANKSAPTIVGSLSLPGNANDVRVVGSLVYVAAGPSGLQIVDVSNPSQPVLRGALTGGDVWDVVVKNGIAYLANGGSGLRIVNVADPASPQQLGTLSLAGTAKGVDVDTARNLAVVAAGTTGVHVINVANPTSPSLIATFAGGDVRDVALSGNYAFLADYTRSFTSVDLTNPSAPALQASIAQSLGGLLQDVVVVGGFALGADVYFVNGVPIIDVSTPQTPVPRAILNFGALRDDNGTGIAADLSYVYLTASQDISENGSSGTTRLYIGQYQQVVDTGGIAPSVQITSPVSSSLIQGETITISANATDDIAVAQVSLAVNGQPILTLSNPPYQTTYTVPVNVVSLSIVANAIDFGNNIGTASLSLLVVPDPLTSVRGRVVDSGGVPIGGATVTTLGKTATSASDGTFTLIGVSTIQGPVVVTAVATQAGTLLGGASASVTPVRGGTTKVGDIRIGPKPFITSLTPSSALAGTSPQITVTGANLNASTFAFTPNGITVTTASIDPSGTSATVNVSIASNATGTFALVGTNPAGSSDALPIVGFVRVAPAFNAIVVPGSSASADPDQDGLTNQQEITAGTNPLSADTDGDLAVDGLEVTLSSDPRDATSLPRPFASGWVTSKITSILNNQNPSTGQVGSTQFVAGRTFSALNSLNPSIGLPGSTQFVSGGTFSLLNGQNPSIGLPGSTQFVSGLTFSMLNAQNPSIGLPG